MNTNGQQNSFAGAEFYALPESFLAQMRAEGLYDALMVSDIGLFPRARGHFTERPGGIACAILILCTGGEGLCEMDGGEPYRLGRGQLTVLPPGTPHRYGAVDSDPWTIYWLHFTGTLSGSFSRWSGVHFPRALSPAACGELEELFARCFSLLGDGCQRVEYFYLCQLVGQILAIVGQSPANAGAVGRGERTVQAAVALMQRSLRGALTLDELAAECGCGVSHLTQLFRRVQQCPPMEYFLRLKMQAAARELYFTDAAVKSVAAEYGYADPFYFSRLFKRIMGASPTEYRRRMKG